MTIQSSSIAETKDNLPKYIHEAEAGNDICITRHGKAVAMLVSIERYKNKFTEEDNGLYGAIMAWRKQLHNDDGSDDGDVWTDEEIDTLRDKSTARDFSWD